MKQKIWAISIVLSLFIGFGYFSPTIAQIAGRVQSIADYIYRVYPTGYVCGTTGPSPNIVEMQLDPRDTSQEMRVRIRKCDGTNFSQNGEVQMIVNGQPRWERVAYPANENEITFDIDPLGEWLGGRNTYQAYVYSNDQPTIPKDTGEVDAWGEFATSITAKQGGQQKNDVGVWFNGSSGTADGYGTYKAYIVDGAGYWDFYAEQKTGYTIEANYAYSLSGDKYTFSVASGDDIVVNYISDSLNVPDDYIYTVSNTGYVCGTGGVIELSLEPSGTNLLAHIRKCDGTNFSKNGKAWVLLNGTEQFGPQSYTAGGREVTMTLDPMALGIVGNNSYQAKILPLGEYQLDYSGSINAEAYLATSLQARLNGSQWNQVGIWWISTGNTPDDYGFYKTYIPDGTGTWDVYAEVKPGYDITANHAYTLSNGYYLFRVLAGEAVVVDYQRLANIGGQILDEGGQPLSGVTVTASGGNTAITDNNGVYTLTNLADGAYTITPNLIDYAFDPVSRTVTLPPDGLNQDFIGRQVAFHIQGETFLANGQPLAGVQVSVPGFAGTTSAGDGTFEIAHLPPNTYLLNAFRSGYRFTPSFYMVPLPPDASGYQFTATPLAPINLTATAGYGNIRLDWTPTNDPTVGHYLISRAISQTAPLSPTVIVTETTYFDTASTLISGQTYCYQIQAVYNNGQIAQTSNLACATLNALNLWLPDRRIGSGKTAIVPVNIRNAQNLPLSGGELWLDYDPTVLKPLQISNTPLTLGYTWSYTLSSQGAYSRAIITLTPTASQTLTGEGALLWLTVEAVAEESLNSALTLRPFNANGGSYLLLADDPTPYPLPLLTSTIFITDTFNLGDLNGNGVVEAVDATIALQIATLQITPTAVQMMAGDTNGDGAVNQADASMIHHYAIYNVWPDPHRVPAAKRAMADPITLRLTDATGVASRGVTLRLTTSAVDGWAGGRFVIVYDPTIFSDTAGVRLKNSTFGSVQLPQRFDLTYNDEGTGLLYIALATGQPVSGAGEVLEIDLTFAPNLPAEITTTLMFAQANLNDVYGRDFATTGLGLLLRRHALVTVIDGHHLYLPLIFKQFEPQGTGSLGF